ncbi:hypothetical protein EPK99_06605 [Neorhizobium lilium]|uniref:Uncharacterized protein n=1 Tax=Neorhizobium lilium TaxID=2503024 RepID=A0A444LH59_9HYPH|nr:hypothetical protein [Neorhizobium lilium]RWX78295.1 hypothetical protein EPK99_06605 [Neorhizobium lilium]
MNDRLNEQYLKIQPDIDRARERLAAVVSSLKDRSPMKHALESLPELIGAEDFTDLCQLLELTDWTRKEVPTGPEFAKAVRARVHRIRFDQESALRREGSRL